MKKDDFMFYLKMGILILIILGIVWVSVSGMLDKRAARYVYDNDYEEEVDYDEIQRQRETRMYY